MLGERRASPQTGIYFSPPRRRPCSRGFDPQVEDRPVVKERVEHVREHRPYEKEFVVETRPTGEVHEAREGRTVEHLGTTEQVVSEAKPSSPCS